jgi:quercetin dioxygenase-like cupin family protein
MSMTKLEILTKAAIQSLAGIDGKRENGFTEFELEQGDALSFRVLKKPGVAIADSFLSEGTIFPYHKHEGCVEILIVYSGQVTVLSDDSDEKHSLSKGDFVTIKKSCGHLLFAKKNSWVVGITLPADKDFPG